MAADPRWQALHQPWESMEAEECKLMRTSLVLEEGKVKVDYASEELKQLMLVPPFFQSDWKQEIAQNPDTSNAQALMRRVISMVDAISEPLVTFRLPSELDKVGFGNTIAKIRNSNRNVSAHFIREPHNLGCAAVFWWGTNPIFKLAQ